MWTNLDPRMDPIDCEFCGTRLADPMLAFLDHVDREPSCRAAWDTWRGNVRREAGGT